MNIQQMRDTISGSDRLDVYERQYPTDSNERLIQAWGDWLRKFPISHIGTFTFRYPVGADHAMREFHKLVQDLGRRSRQAPWGFVVIENTLMGRAHLHAVLNVPTLDSSVIESSWEWRNREKKYDDLDPRDLGHDASEITLEAHKRQRVRDAKTRYRRRKSYRGNAKVEPYDKTRGFTGYMMKNVRASILHYQFVD